MPAAIMAQSPDSKATAAAASKKRTAAASGLDQRPHRPVKRRASKACQCCRSRKVRCNVVEHGAPCTNCRLDQVECIIMESKRRRKSITRLDSEPLKFRSDDLDRARNPQPPHWSAPPSRPVLSPTNDGHVPHPLYRTHEQRSPPAEEQQQQQQQQAAAQHQPQQQQQLSRPSFSSSSLGDDFLPSFQRFPILSGLSAGAGPPVFTPPAQQFPELPGFVRPLPQRMDSMDVAFLQSRGALDLPSLELRNALLESYLEFVDPSMPILEMGDFLCAIESVDGAFGKVSLLVLQAVMFAGSTFVDLVHLRRAGFQSRQQARKTFYQRARLLYDFDYDTDRVSLMQAALLMTFWYEQPDDNKDTWYWLGIAVTVATSIGMNRDPSRSNLDPQRQRLWKRMWWSCVNRDSLVAIGMRRPLRIKTEEHDVPMLTLDDFTLAPIASDIVAACPAAHNVGMRKKLASVFIEQAKLCRHIGHVLTSQYALLSSSLSTEGKMSLARLLPKKHAPGDTAVEQCNAELDAWLAELPDDVRMPEHADAAPPTHPRDEAPYILNRSLCHMIYFMTTSALHRPHARPGDAVPAHAAAPTSPEARVRHAAYKITELAQGLHASNFSRFLPTTGITVLQPALISHLLDVKSADRPTREAGLRGFCQCFQVLTRLRDNWPSAEYSVMLLDAGVRRAEIDPSTWFSAADDAPHDLALAGRLPNAEALVDAGLRLHLVAPPAPRSPSPALDDGLLLGGGNGGGAGAAADDDALARRLGMFLAATPPASDDSAGVVSARDLDREFESLINVDGLDDALDAGLPPMQGESSGFMLDMDFPGTGTAAAKQADADAASAADTLPTPDEDVETRAAVAVAAVAAA